MTSEVYKEVFFESPIPAAERRFDNYYTEKMWRTDAVLSTLIETLEKQDVMSGRYELGNLLATFTLAQRAAQDALEDVEEYVKRLEEQLAAVKPPVTPH